MVPEEHCRAGHVPGAVHLPLEMLNCRAAEVMPELQGLVGALPVAHSAAGYQVLKAYCLSFAARSKIPSPWRFKFSTKTLRAFPSGAIVNVMPAVPPADSPWPS